MTVAMPRRLVSRAMLRSYGKPKGWRGKVERRDPASYQQAPRDCGLRRCTNWTCKLWLVSGSLRCPHCHERQPITPP